jgi:hypothetical protein
VGSERGSIFIYLEPKKRWVKVAMKLISNCGPTIASRAACHPSVAELEKWLERSHAGETRVLLSFTPASSELQPAEHLWPLTNPALFNQLSPRSRAWKKSRGGSNTPIA